MSDTGEQLNDFLRAATWHGPLEPAEAILAEHPELAAHDVFAASTVGDDTTVRRLLARDPASAMRKSGPYEVEPLVYLCLSKYLRLDKKRSASFVRAATALLDAGADPNAGFWLKGEFETALYGAAGLAHHAEMTRLLLERGAVPDDEVIYHAAEGYDNESMKLLVRSGKLSEDQRDLLLLRKIDWHDEEGIRWLLESGARADRISRWGFAALAHALRRDNSLRTIDALLDHGADPTLVEHGLSAVARAARGGRSDVLESLERRGVSTELQGLDRLIAACAVGDSARAQSVAQEEPQLLRALRDDGGELLATFAGTGNTYGVRQLLDLGVDVRSLFAEGDGYYGIAPNSMAIHAAAWRAQHPVVTLLIERGSPVSVADGRGRSPLALAIRACVDSYWTERRSPVSVRALLDAGATLEGVKYPSGYDEVDDLLKAHGVRS